MNVVSLQNVEKSYGTRLLFKEVNLTLTDSERVGLIGVNGTGKSTFLQLIAGLSEPDKGVIERNGKASVYYLPQNPEFEEDASLLENIFLAGHPVPELVRAYEKAAREDEGGPQYLRLLERMDAEGGWELEQQGRTILSKLGFTDVTKPVKQLSGGQRRRLALGQALLYPCDLLLLDEPTNHLDEASIEWLEKYLLARKGGVLLSTHDRYFLDAVCSSMLELSNRHFYRYEGNYEEYLRLKAEREEREAASEEKRRQFLKRELAWVRRGAQARSTKQKARLQRFEALKAMESRRKADTLTPIELSSRLGKTVFDIEQLSFAIGNQPIVVDFTYHVTRHDRIGIVGPNGIGKSCFMRLLEGTYTPQGGTVGRGETVRIAHFTQELPEFDENMRVLDYIREDHRYLVLGDGSTLSAGQVLEQFLFTPELHGVPIRKLSGGERRRLYLLKLLMSAPNVLLLDEPTNDLDIPTLEVLENFLDSFGGVVITVSHDRYFLDRVVDRLFVFTGNGHIRIVHGAYSEYQEEQEQAEQMLRGEAVKVANSRQRGDKSSRNGLLDEGGNEAALADVEHTGGLQVRQNVESEALVAEGKPAKPLSQSERAHMEELEREIASLEGLLKAYEAMLLQVGDDYNQAQQILNDKAEKEAELQLKSDQWLALAERDL